MIKWFTRYKIVFAVIFSSLLQTYALKVFVQSADLLSSGFTGLAILIERITALLGFSFPISLGMLALNIPVAIFCYHHIGKKFVISSMFQVMLTSFLLQVIDFNTMFDDIFLNVCFGGFVYGLSIVIALRGNTSTAGTDFIALYISNKKGKAIWEYVFIFNALMLCIFGYLFGWVSAGYSIVFQFISTKTISSFYHRYKRVTLQMTTSKAQEVVACYIENYRHGISVLDGYGGYSKKSVSLLHTVVSVYEVQEIVSRLKAIDPKIIINIIETQDFVGGFYQAPMK